MLVAPQESLNSSHLVLVYICSVGQCLLLEQMLPCLLGPLPDPEFTCPWTASHLHSLPWVFPGSTCTCWVAHGHSLGVWNKSNCWRTALRLESMHKCPAFSSSQGQCWSDFQSLSKRSKLDENSWVVPSTSTHCLLAFPLSLSYFSHALSTFQDPLPAKLPAPNKDTTKIDWNLLDQLIDMKLISACVTFDSFAQRKLIRIYQVINTIVSSGIKKQMVFW